MRGPRPGEQAGAWPCPGPALAKRVAGRVLAEDAAEAAPGAVGELRELRLSLTGASPSPPPPPRWLSSRRVGRAGK